MRLIVVTFLSPITKKILQAIIFLFTIGIFACDCDPQKITEKYVQSDFVANVTILKIYPNQKNEKGYKADIKINELYKGESLKSIYVYGRSNSGIGSSCDIYIPANTKLIAYARKNSDGNFGIGMCSGIMYLDYSGYYRKKTLKNKKELERQKRELEILQSFRASQNNLSTLKFDTKYFNAVDKWVVFPKTDTDSTYIYGFVYLDHQAGFTFSYENSFVIKEQHLKTLSKVDTKTTNIKYRLLPNTKLVSVLSKAQIKALGLPDQPKWLAIYKQDSDSIDYLKSIGYHYNHVGASHLALEPLLKAYEMDPHFKGLEFELSYAYNALGQFEKAIPILKKAIKNDPKEFYFFKELGFSLISLNKLKEAEDICRKGIKMSDNDLLKSEIAINMAQSYFKIKHREKFDEWAKLARAYSKEGSKYAEYIEYFEKNWDKK